MKRYALVLLLVLVCLGALGWAVSQSAGYVLITYDRFRYESTFWIFLALLACLWLLAVLVHWLLGLLYVSGTLVNPWSRRHRQRRVERASQKGLRELAEGQWGPALEHLRAAAGHDRRPLVHYLGAARAANELGDYAQSDALLSEAREREPDAALAVGLTQAQLQIARGDYVQARESLALLREQKPRHPQVLVLLQQLYVQLEEWPELCRLLPELRKYKVLPVERLDELERLAWAAALEQAGQPAQARDEALQALNQQWQTMPNGLRGEPALVEVYAAGLARLGAEEKAEEVLQAAIRKRFDARLVELYGQVRGRDDARQLAQAEGWLKDHPDDPALLLALGRLSVRNELWGKARDYLEASLRFEFRPQTCAELGRLLARLGEVERSNQLFQQGLGLVERNLPVAVPAARP